MSAIVLAGAVGLGSAAAPARGAGEDEAWLGQAMLAEVARCEGGRAWATLGKRVEAAVLARLACGRLEELGALTDLVYAARLCAYLPTIEREAGGRGLARWLVGHRNVSRRLFRALEESKAREEALKRFAALYAAEPQRVLDYPDLAVAFAATEPLNHYRRQPDATGLVESFRYYTEPGRAFRNDLRAMPFELLRYLADTRASLADRNWAAATYRGKDPSKAYFDVEYDIAHFEKGTAKRIDSAAYTLASLRRVGGVCLDRAYYAAEVCKAVGIPAAIVHGRGGSGVEHAWFAYCRMRSRGTRAVWVSRTGRFRGRHYLVGTVRNPADGKRIYDSELALLGVATHLPLADREQADAATTLARLADGVRDGSRAADLTVVRELAKAYRGRLSSAVGTRWIAARRRIDLSLVEDLLAGAIAKNLAHRPAWRLLLELRKAGRIPVEDLNRFFTVLIDQTGRDYPDFSCLLVMRMVRTLPDAAHRREVYQRAIDVYGSRPDLKGRLLIALGDEHRDAGKGDEALAVYRQAATECVKLAEVVVPSARRAEALLAAGDQRAAAIRLYRGLFSRTEKQQVSGYFRAQTSHFQLGSRLADLLDEAGKGQEAERIRRKL